MKVFNLFMLCLVILLSPPLLHAEEIDKREGCDSCLFKINSLEKPYDLTGQWLFSRKDSEQNKAVNLDTSDWELIKAPGPWTLVELGKTFTVGWYRGVFEFPPELIGQKVVVFMDTYLSRTNIYLDGNLIFRRPDPERFQSFYPIQSIPAVFTISKTRHVFTFRIQGYMMTGPYQLPLKIQKFDAKARRAMASSQFWGGGGQVRLLAAYIGFGFGLFFLLVYFKTRELLYLMASLVGVSIFPFFGFPGESFINSWGPEVSYILHYLGLFVSYFIYLFIQYFTGWRPKLNKYLGVSCLVSAALFPFAAFVYRDATLILIARYLCVSLSFAVIFCACNDLFRAFWKDRGNKDLRILSIGLAIAVGTALNDGGIDFGLYNSYGMLSVGFIILVASILWVASIYFGNTFWENKKLATNLKVINENLENLVTERTKQLQQSEEKYRTILESIQEGYFEVDLTGNFTFFNDSMCRILGYPPEEMMGMNNQQYTDKDHAKRLYKLFAEVYRTGEPAKGSDWQIIRKDGTNKIGEVLVSLQKDSSGNPIGFSGTVRDATERKQSEEALRQSEERYRTILDEMADAYFEVNVAGNYTFVNDACCRHLGYPREELIGTSFRDQMSKEELDKVYKAFGKIYMTGKPERGIFYKLLRKDGTTGFAEMTGFPLRNQQGEVIGFRGVGRDITKRKQMEESLRRGEEKYRTILESIQEGYFEVDLNGKFTFCNNSMSRLTGCSKEELLGMNHKQFTNEETAKEVFQVFDNVYTTGKPSKGFDWQIIRKDGVELFIETSVTLQKDSSGKPTGFKGMIRDITERKRMEQQLNYMATHDALTGLPNRLMFNQLLNQAIRSAQRHKRQLAVFFIDLDRFKAINDSLGHEAGDRLLKEMANRFKKSLRAVDVVGRLGGDEFVIFIEEVEEFRQVEIVAHKLLSSAIKPMVLQGEECRVTASIGISIYPKDGLDEQSLIKNADIAMYFAKEEGKNNYQFFSKDIQSQSNERLSLETNLRSALERNELSLKYQAKVDFKTGMITGVEALLRWDNSYLGSVTPTQFIPVAEETGLIVPIGRWVMKTACAQNVAWQRQGLPSVCMAVNLSLRQLMDDKLLEDIKAALDDSGMAPNLLELEITESMLMHNPARLIAVLTNIKKMGVRLAIDDFGTGYASLAQIKNFPIDTLKVDRSFIRNLPQDSENRAITEAIIAMGKTLSLTVVAEGVETQAQEDFLRDHICDEMQGFYFSKPIAPDQFGYLLRNHDPSSKKID